MLQSATTVSGSSITKILTKTSEYNLTPIMGTSLTMVRRITLPKSSLLPRFRSMIRYCNCNIDFAHVPRNPSWMLVRAVNRLRPLNETRKIRIEASVHYIALLVSTSSLSTCGSALRRRSCRLPSMTALPAEETRRCSLPGTPSTARCIIQ